MEKRHLMATPKRKVALKAHLTKLPRLALSRKEACTLHWLLTGALYPLKGYMTEQEAGEAASPITLEIDPALAARIEVGESLVLTNGKDEALAVLLIKELWHADSQQICVSGPVQGLSLEPHFEAPGSFMTPSTVRHLIHEKGWSSARALFTTQHLSKLDFERSRQLQDEVSCGLVLFCPCVHGDEAILRVRHLLPYYPVDSVILCLLPATEAIDEDLQKQIATNYGCDEVLLLSQDGDEPLHAVSTASVEGVCICLTGLYASGKGSIAQALAEQVAISGKKVSLLDNDTVNKVLYTDLRYNRTDRDISMRRLGFVAQEVVKHGGLAICSPIAPYERSRKLMRAMVEEQGKFFLVYVSTPIEVCMTRDPRGHYSQAQVGLIDQFPGISSPYEVPHDADLVIDTTTLLPHEAAGQILRALEDQARVGCYAL